MTQSQRSQRVIRADRTSRDVDQSQAATAVPTSESSAKWLHSHRLTQNDVARAGLVLPVEGVRKFDEACVRELGLSIELLMEHAGALVAVEALTMLRTPRAPRPPSRATSDGVRVVVLVGPGNNGGDGAVAARLLAARGERVGLCVVAPAKTCNQLCRAQVERAKRAGVDVLSWMACERAMTTASLVIDAMFGAGLSRKLRGNAAKACEAMSRRRSSCQVLSVDVPSGIQGDTGEALGGLCVRADVTLCLTAPKPCVLAARARLVCGRVVVRALPVASPARYEAMLRTAGAMPARAWERASERAQQAAARSPRPSRRSRSQAR